MKLKPKQSLIKSVLVTSLLLNTAKLIAVPIDVKADYYFGPDMSRNQACENAKESAKSKAIAMVTGEKIMFDQQLNCKQTNGRLTDQKCGLNQNAWVLVEGNIRKTEIISENIRTVDGAQICTVSMVVDVIPPTEDTDANFDLQLDLNHNTFRQGEAISINISPLTPMNVVVFNWKPSFTKNNVVRIFPNNIDNDNYISKPITIPSKSAKGSYSLEMEWSMPSDFEKDIATEWVIVVATKKSIHWKQTYDLQNFKDKLAEIPANQKRVVHKPYILLR